MEPTDVLRSLRDALDNYRNACIDGTEGEALDAASTFADAFVSLDEWLSRGGHLPYDWTPRGAKSAAWREAMRAEGVDPDFD
jgi:hypothetical protein